VNQFHRSQLDNVLDGDLAVQDRPIAPGMSCGVDLTEALFVEPESGPSVEFGEPLQDWFEMALKAETPIRPPVRNSWGEDDEEAEDDIPVADPDEEEQDPFDDFDEDDFDDDFDDDFEEELDDEYEIEPADDGLVPGLVEDGDDDDLDEDLEIEPGIEDVD
jgi:hypothetical protein